MRDVLSRPGRRIELDDAAANAIESLVGAPSFPKPGQYVPFFYVSFIAIDQDDAGVFRALLRQAYNDAVTAYNTYRQSFPPIVFANFFGHSQNAELLEFDQAQIAEAPKVSFS